MYFIISTAPPAGHQSSRHANIHSSGPRQRKCQAAGWFDCGGGIHRMLLTQTQRDLADSSCSAPVNPQISNRYLIVFGVPVMKSTVWKACCKKSTVYMCTTCTRQSDLFETNIWVLFEWVLLMNMMKSILQCTTSLVLHSKNAYT